MGRKNKLRKFAEILSFPNVYECYDIKNPSLVGVGMKEMDLKGKWKAEHFKNDNPLTVELACGGGEYAVALARKYPNRNFIGVDIKGNRIWKGARVGVAENLGNLAFLRTRIEIIDQFFAAGEVDEIWITFADPFPRESKSNRRLTSPYFNEKYKQILASEGVVHLKHDDLDFFNFTLETCENDPEIEVLHVNQDIYGGDTSYFPELTIKTHYENMWLEKGKTIRYVRYRFFN